jgi:hypothetical protein
MAERPVPQRELLGPSGDDRMLLIPSIGKLAWFVSRPAVLVVKSSIRLVTQLSKTTR